MFLCFQEFLDSKSFSMFFQCFHFKIAQNLNFTEVFPRFFPQALLCGFSKLQLQTQATAQVGKSHSGRLGARRFLLQKVSFWQYLQRLATPTRRITAHQRSTVTCASKTPSKIDKNMLNLHFVREWHTFFWAQSQIKMKIRRFFFNVSA